MCHLLCTVQGVDQAITAPLVDDGGFLTALIHFSSLKNQAKTMAALCVSAIADCLLTKGACPLPGPRAAAELLPYAALVSVASSPTAG